MKDKKTLAFISGALKGKKFLYGLLIFINVIRGALAVFLALTLKWTINAALKNPFELNYFILCAGFAVGTIALEIILMIVFRLLKENVRLSVEKNLKRSVFSASLKKDYDKTNAYHSGEILNRIFTDTLIVSDGAVGILTNVALMITRFVGALIMLLLMDWLFTLVVAGLGVVLFLCASAFRKILKKTHKDYLKADGTARAFAKEAEDNKLAVKVFGAEDFVSDKESFYLKLYKNAKMKKEKISVLAESFLSAFFNLVYIGALIYGALNISYGNMDYGTLTAMLQLTSQIQLPVAKLSGVLPAYYSMTASAERLMEITEISGEEVNKTVKEEKDFTGITAKDVYFSYGKENVLEGVTFSINKGDFVVIKGISGIGKSTLLQLLLGVYKQNGGEMYYDFGGEKIEPRSLKNFFAYVPQGNMLFSGTIEENVKFVNTSASSEEVENALKISCASDFVCDLPLGVKTVVGEGGFGLSEGQIQRIAIARALVSSAPVIFLDEATSALDKESEEKVLEAIKKNTGKTVIFVTHKDYGIKLADKVFEIKNKKVIVNG